MSQPINRGKPGLSIRTTLILLLTGFTTALLIVVYAATTWLYTTDQFNQVDTFLIRESELVQQDVSQALNPQTGLVKYLSKHANETPAELLHAEPYQNYLKSYISGRLNLPVQFKTTLIIADKTDQELASSNHALELDLRELMAAHANMTDQRAIGAASFLVTVRTTKLTYRLIYRPIMAGETQIGSIRFGCLLDTAISSSLDFAGSTALFLAVAILLNISGSIILVIRILTPVREMSEAVERISEQNLNQRLPILPGNDELSNLSVTFNRALDRISQAWRFQEDLVNDLSHQLRTPLTTLRSSMELALRRERSLPEYQVLIQDGISDIDRLSSLVNTILTVARLEGSQAVLKPAPHDPLEMITEICDDLAPLWDDKGLSIELKSEFDGSFQARFDRFYLQQAIINILDNARKYSPAHGKIRIRLKPLTINQEIGWGLQIANEGPAIPEAALERIFDRFYHPETENSPQGEGFGLGLNIARRIVSLHGGAIVARNLVPRGVVFELILPGLVG
jgi:signal transduction histidine kinase